LLSIQQDPLQHYETTLFAFLRIVQNTKPMSKEAVEASDLKQNYQDSVLMLPIPYQFAIEVVLIVNQTQLQLALRLPKY